MQVRLISYTQCSPVFAFEHNENLGFLSPEELIVYIARVSNPGNQNNMDTAVKLITYLIKNKHWSPFEMVDVTFEIKTSRAIAQQILRHRSFSFQEFSQRYAAVTDMEPVQLRMQADKNRQSSTEELNPQLALYYKNQVDGVIEHAQNVYDAMLKHGIAKECARMILPLTTQTTIYMKGSVRSWIHWLLIRLDEHTQLEHRQIAEEIKVQIKQLFPNIFKALEDDAERERIAIGGEVPKQGD